MNHYFLLSNDCWRGRGGRWWSHHNASPALDASVIGPKDPCGNTAPRTPSLPNRLHSLDGWARLQFQNYPSRLLQGQIAGRPSVRVAKAKQQEDICGPRTDTMDSHQFRMR